MNRKQENFVIENITIFDPRQTGAIPRTVRMEQQQQQQYFPSNYKSTIEKIKQGYRVCIVLRGLPGSGKSYLAQQLVEDSVQSDPSSHIVSADDFFIRNGKYYYDRSRISEAHDSSQKLFCKRASSGYSPLIVDNTNTKYWEMACYLQMAIQYSYHIEIMEPTTPWRFNPIKLAQTNKHRVPLDRIQIMKENYETGVSLKDLAKSLWRLELVQKPLLRLFPPYLPNLTNHVSSNPFTTATVQNDTITNSTNNKSKVLDLIDFNSKLDINKNPKVNEVANNQESFKAEPISWNTFQFNLQEQNKPVDKYLTFNGFKSAEEKKEPPKEPPSQWSPPPQIFEHPWDQPDVKDKEVKEKEVIQPQPQRPQQKQQQQQKQRPKEKKSPQLVSTVDSEFTAHRKHCPNENEVFARLCELYPNVKDSALWDLFITSNGDAEWCANLLFEENQIENMGDGANDLTCDCFTSGNDDDDSELNESSKPKKIKETNAKKQTPIKSKKAKSNTNSDELVAAKMAIEENIKFGEI